MIRIQASVSKGWLARCAGMSFDESYYFNHYERRKRDQEIARFLEEVFPVYKIHNLESNLVELEYYQVSQLQVGGIQPNLILGMLLGAEFIPYSDQDADISLCPLEGLVSAEDLPPPQSLIENPIIQQWTREVTLLKQKESVPIIPPFFWDTGGRAVIHGFFTSACKFLGQRAIYAVYDEPELLRKLFSWMHHAWKALIFHFADAAGFSVKTLHIGECSATMISPETYRYFLVPSIGAMAESIAPVRLHHCGDCTYLLDEIASIAGISSLDVGSPTSVSQIRNLLGNTVLIDVMPPVQLLQQSDVSKIDQWMDTILQENQGGPLRFNYHLEPGYDPQTHLQIHEYLFRRGLEKPGR